MIKQPENKTFDNVKIVWDGKFSRRYSTNEKNAQKYLDAACIRYMDKYTPMMTGKLKQSVILGTKIGSGELVYNSPYARYQYYGKLMIGAKSKSAYAMPGEKKILTNIDLQYNKASHPDASAFWFEKMKAERTKDLKRAVEKIMMGGRGKI